MSQPRHPRAIWNRPGKRVIDYRIGGREAYLQRMLSRLSQGSEFPALAALSTREASDLTIALLDGWATIADILTFYQERLANEAFLGTATEADSIQYLARLLGYEPERGVAASTYLSFAVDEAAGGPRQVRLPAGLPAQSIPLEADKLPQTYELSQELLARPEWNRMLARQQQPQKVSLEKGSLFVERTDNNLNSGDVVLFVNEAEAGGSIQAAEWAWRRLTGVRPEPKSGRTEIKWSTRETNGFLSEGGSPQLYVFRQRAAIFGHNAAQWPMLPDTAKAQYLGAADPATLTDIEKVEWPDFIVPAPKYPLEAIPTYREIPATIESVKAAIRTSCDSVKQGATMDALTAGPNAAIASLRAFSQTASALFTIGNQLSQGVLAGADDSDGSGANLVEELSESLKSFVNNVVPDIDPADYNLTGDDDDGNLMLNPTPVFNFITDLGTEFAGLEMDIADAQPLAAMLQTFVQSNPLVASLLIFNDPILQAAIQLASERNQEAADAIAGLPGVFAKAASAIIVAVAVDKALEAVEALPLPVELLQTPQMVAFLAIYVAKLLEALLGPVGATLALVKELFAFFQTGDQNIKPNFLQAIEEDPDVIAAQSAYLTAMAASAGAAALAGSAIVGVSAIGAVGVGLIGVGGLYGGVGAALIAPIMGPLFFAVAGAAITFVLLKDEIEAGAQEATKTIVDTALAALKPTREPVRERYVRSENSVDLDRQYSRISPDSWLLLSRPDEKARLYRVNGVSNAARSEYNLNAQVTRAHFDKGTGNWFGLTPAEYLRWGMVESIRPMLESWPEAGFDSEQKFHDYVTQQLGVAEADLPIVAAPLLAAVETPNFTVPESSKEALEEAYLSQRAFLNRLLGQVFDSEEDLQAFVAGESGPYVAPILANLPQTEPLFPFKHALRSTTVLAQSESLTIAEEPIDAPVSAPQIALAENVPEIPAGRHLILAGDRAEGDETYATEVVTVESCQRVDGHWLLTVASARETPYKFQRDKLRLLGNVVAATHGQRREEVLGNGAGSEANQQFELNSGPLTYVPASNQTGRLSSLEVRVNGMLWQEIDHPVDLQPGQMAYTTHVTPSGAFTIRFGDGQAGSRLPTGIENVVARYRTGTGLKGNVGVDEIRSLPQRPPGIRDVTNPVRVQGGVDPESPAEMRHRAPGSVRSLGRVVSLSDYVDFATSFVGVGKAFATWYWLGGAAAHLPGRGTGRWPSALSRPSFALRLETSSQSGQRPGHPVRH